MPGNTCLLYYLSTGRVVRDVEMQDPVPTVFDDEETIQDCKGQRRHREEIHSRDHPTVIAKEGRPKPIGLITLDEKCAGARSAVNPHAACDAAGAGDGATGSSKRARREKSRMQSRTLLRATAPVPDATGGRSPSPFAEVLSFHSGFP